MTTFKSSDATKDLDGLIRHAAQAHEPVLITGEQANAILVSEDDWRSVQETLYLLSIPGMRESIREGLQTPISECSKDLEW